MRKTYCAKTTRLCIGLNDDVEGENRIEENDAFVPPLVHSVSGMPLSHSRLCMAGSFRGKPSCVLSRRSTWKKNERKRTEEATCL